MPAPPQGVLLADRHIDAGPEQEEATEEHQENAEDGRGTRRPVGPNRLRVRGHDRFTQMPEDMDDEHVVRPRQEMQPGHAEPGDEEVEEIWRS